MFVRLSQLVYCTVIIRSDHGIFMDSQYTSSCHLGIISICGEISQEQCCNIVVDIFPEVSGLNLSVRIRLVYCIHIHFETRYVHYQKILQTQFLKDEVEDLFHANM